MTRIIINGCFGRMGKVLTAALKDQDDLVLAAGIDLSVPAGHSDFPVFTSLESCNVEADAVVDFSNPDSLSKLLPAAVLRKIAVVIATTGLMQNHYDLIKKYSQDIPVFHSANMSVGINLVKDLIKKAALILGNSYDIEIVEMHHRMKKDSPSGTALLLYNALNEVLEPKMKSVCGRESDNQLRTSEEIGIHAIRGGTVIGDHDVIFAGPDELVKLSHKAFSRQIFAMGSLKAAKYIAGKKPGIYTMDKMISESNVVTDLYTIDNEVLISIANLPAKMSVVTGLLGVISQEEVNIDMISQANQAGGLLTVSFSLFKSDLLKTEKVIKNFLKQYPEVYYICDPEVSKITVEGPGMEQQSGVAYKVFSSLEKENIQVKAVSTSETKISSIIDINDKEKAVSILKEILIN